MELDIKLINKVLAGIVYPHAGLTRLNINKTITGIGDHNGWEGNQGDFNETEYYYSHKELPENVFLKIVKRTDSYGDNEYTHSIQFVQGVAKQVTVYEPI